MRSLWRTETQQSWDQLSINNELTVANDEKDNDNVSICSLYLIRCSFHTYNQVDGKEDVDERKHIRCLCHRPTVTLDRPGMKPKFRLLNSSSRLYDTAVHFKIDF